MNYRSKLLKEIPLLEEDDCYIIPCIDEDDARHERWEAQRNDYGFDERAAWRLRDTIERELYVQLRMFQMISQKWDLSVDEYEYCGETYLLIDLLEMVIVYLALNIMVRNAPPWEFGNEDPFIWENGDNSDYFYAQGLLNITGPLIAQVINLIFQDSWR